MRPDTAECDRIRQRVRACEQRVERQREIVQRWCNRGWPLALAVRSLHTLEDSLRVCRQQLAELEKRSMAGPRFPIY